MILRSFGPAFCLQLDMYIPLYIDHVLHFWIQLRFIQLMQHTAVCIANSLIASHSFWFSGTDSLMLFWTPFLCTWRSRSLCSMLADNDLSSTAPFWMSPPKETNFLYLFKSILKLLKQTHSLAASKHRWFMVEEANQSCISDCQPLLKKLKPLSLTVPSL